jgi:hypothetical protein
MVLVKGIGEGLSVSEVGWRVKKPKEVEDMERVQQAQAQAHSWEEVEKLFSKLLVSSEQLDDKDIALLKDPSFKRLLSDRIWLFAHEMRAFI